MCTREEFSKFILPGRCNCCPYHRMYRIYFSLVFNKRLNHGLCLIKQQNHFLSTRAALLIMPTCWTKIIFIPATHQQGIITTVSIKSILMLAYLCSCADAASAKRLNSTWHCLCFLTRLCLCLHAGSAFLAPSLSTWRGTPALPSVLADASQHWWILIVSPRS